MQLTLKVLEGSRHGMEVPVPGPKFFVGRDEDCHLRPQSDMVSRHHCVLLVEPGYVAVRDFGSKNGTYVNGQKIDGEQPLKAGDRLAIGPLLFEVVVQHVIGGPKRPKVKDMQDVVDRSAQAAAGAEVDVSNWLVEDESVMGGGPSPHPALKKKGAGSPRW
ncbi:MAG: FHA domain-containing protein [Planctomycetia bacterium]|nr:FHA domain-containing protein [Planctomycetia bacterium]